MTMEFTSRRGGSPLPGVSSAGFERFFQTLGEPADADTYPATPLGLPPGQRFGEAGQRFDTTFLPGTRMDT